MNKNDLKDGMVLVHRNGEEYILIQDGLFKNDFTSDSTMFDYNNDLTHKENKYNDLMQIFSIGKMIELWKREEVDWSKIPIDTKVLVGNIPYQEEKRYFAKYEKGIFYTYGAGCDSWSYDDCNKLVPWYYCKLAEDLKEEVTYKKMMESIDKICNKHYKKNKTCSDCVAYNRKGLCNKGIIADGNFIITRK